MLFKLLMFLTLFGFSHFYVAQAKTQGIVVVANTQDEVKLSKQELKRLFMGAYIGYDLTAVILPIGHEIRVEFNTSVIGLTEDRIQSYWAQMRFSGRRQAPQQLNNENEVMSYILSHDGAISYFAASTEIPEGLKVIYRTPED